MLRAVGEVLLYALSFALSIAVPATIVRWDLGRLRGERLARAWPDSSVWSAVVVFGPLCLPVHFIRTRRNWAGIGLGVLALGAAVLLISLPVEGLARLFGIAE
jgi:hypothetical protein